MKISRPTKIVLAVVVIAIIAGIAYSVTMTPQPAAPPTPKPEEPKLRKVTFMLNWGEIGGPQAPWFVTLDKGFFKEQGLDVEIIPGRGSSFAVTQVAAGKADLGQAAADVMIAARAKGEVPVKIVYQVFQDNPAGIASAAARGIKAPQDLSGKTLNFGMQMGGVQDFSWDILVKKLGIDVSKHTRVGVGFDPVSSLASGKVDTTSMWDDDLPDFDVAGVKVNAFFFKDYGLNYPTLAIISTDKYLKENPEIVKKFVAAAHKGVQYTIDHPGEAVDIVLKYTAYNLPKNTAQFFAKLQYSAKDIKGSKPGQALGKIDAQSLSDLQDLLLDFKKIDKKLPVSDYYTLEFLPK